MKKRKRRKSLKQEVSDGKRPRAEGSSEDDGYDTEIFEPEEEIEDEGYISPSFMPLLKLKAKERPKSYDHLYLITTENIALEALKTRKIRENTWVGCSGLYNLDAVTLRGSLCKDPSISIEHIIITDSSPTVIQFWRQVIRWLQECTDSKSFMALLREYPGARRQFLELRGDIFSGVSFLSDVSRFGQVQDIAKAGHLIPVEMDISDPGAMLKLADLMKKKNMVLDTFYVSNIAQYLAKYGNPVDLDNFTSNVKNLFNPDALIIDAVSNRYLWRSDFPQQVCKARHFLGKRRRSPRLPL